MPGYWLPCPLNMKCNGTRSARMHRAKRLCRGAKPRDRFRGGPGGDDSPMGKLPGGRLAGSRQHPRGYVPDAAPDHRRAGSSPVRAPRSVLAEMINSCRVRAAAVADNARGFLEHDVSVGSTDPERAYASPARSAVRHPRSTLGACYERRASRSSFGLGLVKLTSGGICRFFSASTVLIRLATPAATSRWPRLALSDPSRQKPTSLRRRPERAR